MKAIVTTTKGVGSDENWYLNIDAITDDGVRVGSYIPNHIAQGRLISHGTQQSATKAADGAAIILRRLGWTVLDSEGFPFRFPDSGDEAKP